MKIKELHNLFKKFSKKGGKMIDGGNTYMSNFKEFSMAFKMEKIKRPNLTNNKILNTILKSTSYNENYDPQEASEQSFTKEITKALRKGGIYIKETRLILKEDGSFKKQNVFAKLHSENIKYLTSGKTKSGRSYTAFEIYNNGNYYYALEIQSPKEGLGAEWYTFDSKDSLLNFVQNY